MALLVVLSFIIYAFFRAFGSNLEVHTLINSKRSVQDARQAFETELINRFRADACFEPATEFSAVMMTGLGRMDYTTEILGGVNLSKVSPAPMTSNLIEAKARCINPRPPATVIGVNPNFHRYFCVAFLPGAAPPAGSFIARPGAFAEVYIESRDFQTGQALDCHTVNGSGAGPGARSVGGAAILYTLYWPASKAGGVTWQSYNGALNVSTQ